MILTFSFFYLLIIYKPIGLFSLSAFAQKIAFYDSPLLLSTFDSIYFVVSGVPLYLRAWRQVRTEHAQIGSFMPEYGTAHSRTVNKH